MKLIDLIPVSWRELLGGETTKQYFYDLDDFVSNAYSQSEVFPPYNQIFRALELCAPQDVRVVIVGQDPYHGEGQACGLSFSVPSGVKLPPSLRNILKEVEACGYNSECIDGNLERWASQGVLLLNSVLTVQAHSAASHAGKGWERVTDSIIESLNGNFSTIVYMLWGSYAQRKASGVDSSKNLILTSVHPSPLSAHRGWFGSRHFALANDYLHSHNLPTIEW